MFTRNLAILAFAVFVLTAAEARAYSRGASFSGCVGCHGEGDQSAELFALGDLREGEEQRMRLVVRGDGGSLGFSVNVDGGSLSGGSGMRETDYGLTHSRPFGISGGTGEVDFGFTPTSGAVRFRVATLVTNGDGGRGGDGGGEHQFDFVVGCEGELSFRDQDDDGWGGEVTRLFCAGEPGEGYVSRSGDCDDFRSDVNPGAEDPCNQRDDNCNGIVDDGAEEVVHYPDADRDGYYSREERESGEEFFGCSEVGGPWAALRGDCAPDDPERNPGVEEVCDLIDNDCDFDIDERKRPQCGEGWCRRNSRTCDVEDCVPGPTRDEVCNLFDDDCDGFVDEDTCPRGQRCVDFACSSDEPDPDPDPDPDPEVPPVDDGGCSMTSGRPGHPVLLLLVLPLLGLLKRR